MLKARLDVLQRVFARFSGKDDKPSAPYRTPYAGAARARGRLSRPSLRAFSAHGSDNNMFVERVGFVDSEMGLERETKMCFLKALQTRPDEMATDEHRKMQFVEFVEALCRVADMKDLRVSRAEVPPFAEAAKKTGRGRARAAR